MAVTSLGRALTTTAVAATASATSAPSSSTDGFLVQSSGRVRTLLTYAGTVSSCNLKIWFRDRLTGVWYEGAATDDLDALTPGGATPVNEARDWDAGAGSEVFFQIAAIAGGGTASVKLQAVHV
jgi:hypothetical protein